MYDYFTCRGDTHTNTHIHRQHVQCEQKTHSLIRTDKIFIGLKILYIADIKMQSNAEEVITIATIKQQHLSQTVQSRLARAANVVVAADLNPSARSELRQGEESRSELQGEGRTLHYITQQTPSGGGVENAMATA